MFDNALYTWIYLAFSLLLIYLTGHLLVKGHKTVTFWKILIRNIVWAFRRRFLRHTIRDKSFSPVIKYKSKSKRRW